MALCAAPLLRCTAATAGQVARHHSRPDHLLSVQIRPFLSLRPREDSPLLRFAPSPTGHLHLGGLRTALFNHLFARKLQGKWLLRIEDTDQKRFVEGSAEAMQDILRWSGLDYDEGPDRPGKRGPFLQSQRLHLYASYGQRLVQSGKAYRDFRVEEDSTIARADVYMPPSAEEEERLQQAGKKFTIRLRMPKTSVQLDDLVYGKLTFPYDEAIGDPVLVKSDGWPTYHLANIVDDHEMGVTHVLRGEEWLPSIPIHLAIYKALRLQPPTFVHLPLLVNLDGSKLSKRHADVHVESYRQKGFEPEALLNFVALMGYNWHGTESVEAKMKDDGGDDTSEVFTMQDMIDKFEPSRISHTRATPNLGKLDFLNRQHLIMKVRNPTPSQRQDVVTRLSQMIQARWPDRRLTGYLAPDRVMAMAQLYTGRATTLQDIVKELALFFEMPDWNSLEARDMLFAMNPLEYERVIWQTHDFLSSMHGRDIERLPYLEAALRDLAVSIERKQSTAREEQKTMKKGRGAAALMKPLRLALTGKKSGPTVAETISLLGQGPTLERLEAAMQHFVEMTDASKSVK